SMTLSSRGLLVGGSFASVGGQPRSNLAALDVATGRATNWKPRTNPEGEVSALAVNGSTVYAGGSFSTILRPGGGSDPRKNLAAFDATTGALRSWRADAATPVRSLAASSTVVYAGGSYPPLTNPSESRLYTFDAQSGVPLGWQPDVPITGGINALELVGQTLVVASGPLGEDDPGLAALDAVGLAARWVRPEVVSAFNVDLDASRVYASYTTDFTVARLVAMDLATGAVQPWAATIRGRTTQPIVWAVRAVGPDVFVGGVFEEINGVSRINVGAVDAQRGAVVRDWRPRVNGFVRVMEARSALFLGGEFTSVNNFDQTGVAAFE
ncbi:MAG: hypothetical protein WKH64_18930, partial [Chloroflexia bacterium]